MTAASMAAPLAAPAGKQTMAAPGRPKPEGRQEFDAALAKVRAPREQPPLHRGSHRIADKEDVEAVEDKPEEPAPDDDNAEALAVAIIPLPPQETREAPKPATEPVADRHKAIRVSGARKEERQPDARIPAAEIREAEPADTKPDPSPPEVAVAAPPSAPPVQTRASPALDTLGLIALPRQARASSQVSDERPSRLEQRPTTDDGVAADLPEGSRIEPLEASEPAQARQRNPLSDFAMRLGATGERFGQKPGGEVSLPQPNVAALPAMAAGQPAATVEALVRDIAQAASPRMAAAEVQGVRDARAPSPGMVQTLRLHLEPVQLGPVTVELDASGSRMEVEVTVETEEAHRHLAGDADRIVHALRSLGFEIDRVQINFSHQQAQSASAQSDRQPQLQGGASGNGGGHDRNGGPSRGTGGEAVPGDNDVQDQRPRQRDLYI